MPALRTANKGKIGLCILSSAKKKPFLADPKYLKYKGIYRMRMKRTTASSCGICRLMTMPQPRFKECARHPHIEEKGYVLYYTSQCPFNAKYVPILKKRQKGRSTVSCDSDRIQTGDRMRLHP